MYAFWPKSTKLFRFHYTPIRILDDVLNEFPIKLVNLWSSLAGDNFHLKSKNICHFYTV